MRAEQANPRSEEHNLTDEVKDEASSSANGTGPGADPESESRGRTPMELLSGALMDGLHDLRQRGEITVAANQEVNEPACLVFAGADVGPDSEALAVVFDGTDQAAPDLINEALQDPVGFMLAPDAALIVVGGEELDEPAARDGSLIPAADPDEAVKRVRAHHGRLQQPREYREAAGGSDEGEIPERPGSGTGAEPAASSPAQAAVFESVSNEAEGGAPGESPEPETGAEQEHPYLSDAPSAEPPAEEPKAGSAPAPPEVPEAPPEPSMAASIARAPAGMTRQEADEDAARRNRVLASLTPPGSRTQTAEQSGLSGAPATLRSRLKRLAGATSSPEEKSLSRPRVRLISGQGARVLRAHPHPAVAVFGNNKGGVGKTTSAVNTAATLSAVLRPTDSEIEALNVLLVDQNYGNADIEQCVRLAPGEARGLVEYATARAAGADVHVSDYARPVAGAENFDVLTITGGGPAQLYAGTISPEVMEYAFSQMAESYDAVVVDIDNSLAHSDLISAGLLRFWLSLADVAYVVSDGGMAASNAVDFVSGSRASLAADSPDEDISPPMVPIFNDRTNYEDLAGRAQTLQSALLEVGFDHPASEEPVLSVPHDPRVESFALEGRQIALESPALYRAYESIVMDLLARVTAARMKELRAEAEAEHTGEQNGKGV